MNKLAPVCFCGLVLISSATSQAEYSPPDLLSMGNLVTLIGKAGMAYTVDVEADIFDANGRISSNLPAPDTARGLTADQLARLLSGGSEPLRQRLIAAFLNNRDRFMENLSSNNYAANDMGVAYAVSFVLLWELASNGELTQSASDKAAKFLVHRFRSMNTEYANLTLEEKAKAYDWLITAPVAIATLVIAFEKEGRNKEAAKLREKSASLFLSTFKVPHDMLSITQKGEVNLDVEKVIAYQQRHGLSGERQ